MRTELASLALSVLAAILAAPASADVAAGGREIPCTCRDSHGGVRELGQEVCLVVDGRAFMARCEMALNVTTWRDTGMGCASSGLEGGGEVGGPVLEPGAIDAEIVPSETQS